MRLAFALLVLALVPLTTRGQPASPLYEAAREAGALPADAAALTAAMRAQEPTQEARLVAADRAPNSFFGGSVSLSGNRALIGAFGEDGDRGAAYVFVRSGSTWTQEARLIADDRAPNGSFGIAVSLSDDRALVGAYGADNFQGAAYVFVRSGSTWTQEARLTATGASAADLFGNSVSLSDGRALVGAPENDDLRGTAYVFVRSGSAWTQEAQLIADDRAADDFFGGSVSLSGDRALVGAFGEGDDQGAAYVFTRSGSTWMQEARLVADDGAPGDFGGDYFGFSVALSDDDALIGAYGNNNFRGAAYVFTRIGLEWTQQAKLVADDAATSNFFGDSVSILGDQALIGSSGAVAARGAAYVFARSDTQWVQEARLTAPDSEPLDIFGFSVSLSGSRALVGVRGDDARRGSAYVFAGVKPVGIDIEPESPPVVVPASGGKFAFSLTLTNQTDEPQTFAAWTEATLPDGTVVGPGGVLLGPVMVTLGPGETVTRRLVQRVPAAAPAGAYTYTALVGSFPDAPVAADGFPVAKQPAADGALASAGAGPVGWAVVHAGSGAAVVAGEGWASGASAGGAAGLPAEYALAAAAPNPSAGVFAVPLLLPEAAEVRAEAYDLLGRRVAVLAAGPLEAGTHRLALDGSRLAAGVYVVRAVVTAAGGTVRAFAQRVTVVR